MRALEEEWEQLNQALAAYIADFARRTERCRTLLAHYMIFSVEVGTNMSESEVKNNWRAAHLREHPDKNRDDVDRATERAKLVNAAYDYFKSNSYRLYNQKCNIHGS